MNLVADMCIPERLGKENFVSNFALNRLGVGLELGLDVG